MSDAPLPPPSQRRITSTRDKAKMTYLPPDLDVEALIASTPNFKAIPRLDATQLETKESFASLEEFIQKHVIAGGTPLVIENWHMRADWPWYIFTTQWLTENNGTDHINVRDLNGGADVKMTLAHYLKNLPKLANKFTPHDYAGKQQRLYAKDIDCPVVWRDKLQEILPPSTFYLSAQGDLMSSLPEHARAENMMCYFGHEGTYTPAHKEMCASLGQNIMVDASSGSSEPGTSIWFMTQSADRDIIAEYWLSRMGHDIEVEKHFASIDDLQDAPFPVYIHEQRVGDYILVPPLAPHQVWNRGESTLKAAWNRITVDTLELAISEALPKARLVCRNEEYKNRAIIYETLKEYAQILNGEKPAPHMDMGKMRNDFVRLFRLFDKIVLDECFSPELTPPAVEKIENEYNVTCSYCRGNIWNRFLSCKNCVEYVEGEDEDCYDVCMDCYARGRSCFCVSKLDWVEQHDWKIIERDHEEFRQTVMDIQGVSDDNPVVSLSTGLKQLGRKSLARVCQEQLKVRPWCDLNKNGLEDGEEDEETKKREGKSLNCHVCKVRHDSWKCAECSSCTKVYCYGNLWRAFDMDPFDDILCKFAWKCPVCLGVCSCGACRKKGETQPYEPKGTFLGASTKYFADPRSAESLVDFAKGNLGWIRDLDVPAASKRKRASTIGFDYLGMIPDNSFDNGHVPVDPALDTRITQSPTSLGFTAVNAENGASSADVEGSSFNRATRPNARGGKRRRGLGSKSRGLSRRGY